MMFKDITAVYRDKRTKHINKNAELLIVKAGGTYTYHWSLKCSFTTPTTQTVRSLAENTWLECGVLGDVMPCDRERYKKLAGHIMRLSVPKKNWLASQQFYSASGCAISDLSVRLESESLP
jgi:hypothetical protein